MTPPSRAAIQGYLVVLAAIAIVPFLSSGGYHTYLATLILIYAIAAIGLNVFAGYAGQTSLGHAAFMAIGAYGTALLGKFLDHEPFWGTSGLSMPLGVAAGTIAAGVGGALLAYPALRVRGPYLAMLTMLFGWIGWRILIEWVPVTGGDLGLADIPKLRVGAFTLGNNGYYYVVLALFVAVFVFQWQLARSRLGLLLRGIKHEELLVASAGIPVRRVKAVAFVISSAVAGFAGGLYAIHQSYINPDSFQIFDSIFILLVVLLGGAGTLLGPLVGAAVLVVLPEMLQSFGDYRLIIYGCLIILNLYVLPSGLVGATQAFTKPNGSRPAEPRSRGESRDDLPTVNGARLEFESVCRVFGGVVALKDVSLRVEPGTIHAVIGPNGAGKSTLVNVATGATRADAGRVLLDGRQVSSRSLDEAARRGIVRTFQHVRTLGELTVLEHLLIPLGRGDRHALKSQYETAHRLMNAVGIGSLEDSPATKLSHGHRRLLDLARALATRPRACF